MATTTSPTMNLRIVNQSNSGVGSDKVFVSLLGTDPATNQFGYLDFATGRIITTSPFVYVPGTTSKTLAQLQALGPTIAVPPIQSARIYFAINNDFEPSLMVASGPTASANNPALFDKIEFDTHQPGYFNINGTSVDFFGISYTISAIPSGKTEPVTVGFDKTRTEIIKALNNVVASPPSQQFGNTNIFKACIIKNGGEALRVLSPKTMALTDWGATQQEYTERATMNSHFLDQYVNQHCWAPNRTFSFYDKNWPGQLNQIFGRVSADGLTLNLFTDAAMTVPYAPVPTLPRPSAAWPNPSFQTPTNYHQTNSQAVNGIDWGFLLIGNVLGTGAGANWASDPAAMAIMVSIDRGVMHMNDGTTAWVTPANYYKGNGSGVSTEDMPILFYSSILHQFGLNGQAYVLSFDDVYGENPTIAFASGAEVTVTLNSLESVKL